MSDGEENLHVREQPVRDMGHVIQVAAGVIFRGDHILISRRKKGSHLAGYWEFPGGKMEPGETSETCLKRELREELAVEVEVGEVLEVIEHAYPEKTVRLQFHRCVWKRGEPQALDCEEVAWVKAAELGRYQFPEADAQLLRKLEKGNET